MLKSNHAISGRVARSSHLFKFFQIKFLFEFNADALRRVSQFCRE